MNLSFNGLLSLGEVLHCFSQQTSKLCSIGLFYQDGYRYHNSSHTVDLLGKTEAENIQMTYGPSHVLMNQMSELNLEGQSSGFFPPQLCSLLEALNISLSLSLNYLHVKMGVEMTESCCARNSNEMT